MSEVTRVPSERVDALLTELQREAEAGGYHLNPDREFTRGLVQGLLVNEERYGYRSCPCRLAADDRDADLDIVCPCDYRDADLSEWGACYCALYVSEEILRGEREPTSVPERRPPEGRAAGTDAGASSVAGGARTSGGATFPLPVWRCRVCGYLCAREGPPEICPICKATKDRFERFA